MKFKLLKDWRILLVLIAVLMALFAIHPTFQEGIIVESVDINSPLYGKIQPGETIDWANEVEIRTIDDFYNFEDFVGVFRYMHSGQLDLVEIKKPGLGITVVERPFSNIKLGMDMVG